MGNIESEKPVDSRKEYNVIYAECLLQGESETIHRQRQRMETTAKQHGWVIAKVYAEPTSAAESNMTDRTAIQDLLADAVQKRFDVLMFEKTKHLGCDDEKVAAFLLQLDWNGISLYHAEENQLSLATGVSMCTFLEGNHQ